MEYEQFDRRLARECAKAFSQSTGLGCTLSDKTGRAFDEYGYGCESCGMCAAAGASHDRCVQAHIYGMTEAERFGGIDNVPGYGITMGLKTITEARNIILLAYGEEKSAAVYQMVYGKTMTYLPASFLQIPLEVTVYLDTAAASKL